MPSNQLRVLIPRTRAPRLRSEISPLADTGFSIKPKDFRLVQTNIIDYFCIKRFSESTFKFNSADSKKKQKRKYGTKKSRKLLPFSPCKDPRRRIELMDSIKTTLMDKGAKFSNELTYPPGMAPRSANCASLDQVQMQVLSREDTECLNMCKSMMKRGEWPPLMVVFDPNEGYTVVADELIKDLTIIAEYVGDVDYLLNCEYDDVDSLMTLISAFHISKTLVICPDKRANISRFISGINNETPDGKKKVNLKSVRYNVNGEARVLLICIRDILKGERLYYDYNGCEHAYPTHNFV